MSLEQTLPQVSIFSRLDAEEIKELIQMIKVEEVKKGDIVFHFGEGPADLHFLIKGQLRSVRYSEDGKETVMHLIHEKEAFALTSAYLDIPYTGTAIAAKNSIVAILKRADFVQFLKKYPEISLKIMGSMAQRTSQLLTRIEEQTNYTPMERVVRFLTKESKRQQSDSFRLPLGKADLARILGTVPETLSRCLAELAQKGLIRVEGKQITLIEDLHPPECPECCEAKIRRSSRL